MKVSLVVSHGSATGKEIPLKGPSFVIGRDKGCQLRPASDMVSKQHCRFEITKVGVTLADLDSTNGTFVNGKRLQPHQRGVLSNGDEIKVGPLTFLIQVEAPIVPANPKGKQSDDDVMDWLIDDAPAPVKKSLEEDSTVMDLSAAVPPTVADEPAPAEKGQKAPAAKAESAPAPNDPNKKDTHAAASELLNKYFVRRRPS